MGLFSWILLSLVVFVNAQSVDECPALFIRYSINHSYCKPTQPTCNILVSGATDDDIAVILREHNTLRSRLASGKAQKLPPASNMMQMVWDNELAAVAQKHANQCQFEHDCSNCRRVQNFGVGQNLAIETISPITPNHPPPNWPSAIKSWHDEIKYFKTDAIESYQPNPPTEETFGHFTQLVWADSWRIGCGYVLYTKVNTYEKLYVCNYGPAGNTLEKNMYKVGAPCSDCPINSCCGKTCGAGNSAYQELCMITDDRGPTYKPKESYIFYCDFQNQPDCKFNHISGTNNWLVYDDTLSGNYLGIVLKGNESSTLVFENKIKPTSSSFCFVINYRKGPNMDGEEDANNAIEIFTIPSNNYVVTQNLPSFSNDVKQQFSQYSMSMGWNMETEIKITFSVPFGKPEQFFEVSSLYATDGPC